MRFNFAKIATIATSALLVGLTMGSAAAANYPLPFVSSGGADVAVVYGTGAGVSALDLVEAGNIQSDLSSRIGTSSGSGSAVTGGDSFKLERTSTFFHLGDNMTAVYSSDIDDNELPQLLADGIYVDDDNDEFDFTQKIVLGLSTQDPNLQLGMFEDNDYAEDEPTIGFRIPSGKTVMTYTLTMTDQPEINDLPTSDLVLMGKSYYVLSNSSSGVNHILTLLDSAEEAILDEGSTATVAGHSVSVTYLSSTEVKLIVDGQTTNSLSEGQTQKLTDGSYVGIKDILYNSKEGTTSSVEFSIGTGKLKLTSGSDVEINDDVVNDLTATITNASSTQLSSITLAWAADDDLFITETSSVTMPGFGAVKLSFGGLNYPAEEQITVERGSSTHIELSSFPLKTTTATIPLLYGTSAGTYSGIGKDVNSKLVTSADGVNMTFDSDTDDMFIASWAGTAEAESYMVRATNFITESTVDKADFQYHKDGTWTTFKTKAIAGDTFSLGSVDFLIYDVSNTNNNLTVANNSASVNFNTLFSKEGAKFFLPVDGANDSAADGVINLTGSTGSGTLGHNGTSFYLAMHEEDKDDNIASGDGINVTLAWDSGSTAQPQVSAIATTNTDATSTEIGETDVFRDFTYSALATEMLFAQPSSGQKSLKLMYHGTEVKADVYITSPDATVTGGVGGGSALGNILVKDSEVSSVSSKNLVVIGGSCINSAAANLVGGALCGSSWTDSTGAGSGQFLIESYGNAYTSGKVALLVAGYDASDTVNAATYLRTQAVNTASGSKYLGTSSTSATLQVA